jgi:hypothetical protein
VTTLGVERGNAIDLQGIADSPAAVRSRKPRWTQFRFLGGVLLVVGSVLVGAKLIAGADESSIALVAARPLTVGMSITDADVRPVKVRLIGDTATYLAGSIPPGYVVLRPIGAGELLPKAAIGGSALLQPVGTYPFRWVTVPVTAGHYPPGIRSGDTVDIYTSPNAGSGGTASATLLLANVTVDQGVGAQGGGLGGGSAGSSVVLIIPSERVVDVLTAIQSGVLNVVSVHQNKAG